MPELQFGGISYFELSPREKVHIQRLVHDRWIYGRQRDGIRNAIGVDLSVAFHGPGVALYMTGSDPDDIFHMQSTRDLPRDQVIAYVKTQEGELQLNDLPHLVDTALQEMMDEINEVIGPARNATHLNVLYPPAEEDLSFLLEAAPVPDDTIGAERYEREVLP